MTAIPDDKLYDYASRLKNRVVVITGAANGIGRETALQLALYGAKVVIGDLDVLGAQKTVNDIESAGGTAVFLKCNVTVWEEQVALFELATSQFGAVDIVVPNAGVAELGTFDTVTFKDGKPVKPDTRTLEVNLTGAVYTTHLALHYLGVDRDPEADTLKAVVLIGSMDTNIIPIAARLFLAGIPLTPVPRIAGAIIYAATNPDPETNGVAFLLTDDGPVFMVPREEFKMGVYKMIDERANALLKGASGLGYYFRLLGDLRRILGKPIVMTGIALVVAKMYWDHRELLGEPE
ncbi:hypothetical protein H0H81_001583 [Sphagnurus paluster]|uniref:Uncharacterized protein n=1 Tax=Sphagnurus paluster TaxID=117069 RepID=A0A9P7K5U8_9AGAR|nr:hypothetical protein H0H81_001583 [Sphagnurus paluster]